LLTFGLRTSHIRRVVHDRHARVPKDDWNGKAVAVDCTTQTKNVNLEMNSSYSYYCT
jgi:hypothetical protein